MDDARWSTLCVVKKREIFGLAALAGLLAVLLPTSPLRQMTTPPSIHPSIPFHNRTSGTSKARQDKARQGMAWHGMAWHGMVKYDYYYDYFGVELDFPPASPTTPSD